MTRSFTGLVVLVFAAAYASYLAVLALRLTHDRWRPLEVSVVIGVLAVQAIAIALVAGAIGVLIRRRNGPRQLRRGRRRD